LGLLFKIFFGGPQSPNLYRMGKLHPYSPLRSSLMSNKTISGIWNKT